MMNKLRLLRIWNRLKRQLRSILIRTGTGKPIVWADEFREFMAILKAVADVQDSMERSGEIPPDQSTGNSAPEPQPKTQEPTTNSNPESTTDSPYDNLVPTARQSDQETDAPPKKGLFRRWRR